MALKLHTIVVISAIVPPVTCTVCHWIYIFLTNLRSNLQIHYCPEPELEPNDQWFNFQFPQAITLLSCGFLTVDFQFRPQFLNKNVVLDSLNCDPA